MGRCIFCRHPECGSFEPYVQTLKPIAAAVGFLACMSDLGCRGFLEQFVILTVDCGDVLQGVALFGCQVGDVQAIFAADAQQSICGDMEGVGDF